MRTKLYGKLRMGEVIESEGQGCTVSIGWERLLGVRTKLYGKHTMGELIRCEDKAVGEAWDGRGYRE